MRHRSQKNKREEGETAKGEGGKGKVMLSTDFGR